jgi:hypothetical protein
MHRIDADPAQSGLIGRPESCHDGDICTVIRDSGQRVTIRLHGGEAVRLTNGRLPARCTVVNSLWLLDGR